MERRQPLLAVKQHLDGSDLFRQGIYVLELGRLVSFPKKDAADRIASCEGYHQLLRLIEGPDVLALELRQYKIRFPDAIEQLTDFHTQVLETREETCP